MNRITEVTRRDIYDIFHDGLIVSDIFATTTIEYPYYGRLEEIEFLERVYDLDQLPSSDSRYSSAREDIIQHTVNNDDYPKCWVFHDDRFQLDQGPDNVLLRFLCEVFHPMVRDEHAEWEMILAKINELLRTDCYELYVEKEISGRAAYGYRLCGAEVVDQMDDKALIDLIELFKSGLLSKATNGDMDESEYTRCRNILLKVPKLTDLIPSFIKSNKTAADFRRYIQGQAPHYVDRRRIITTEMDKLIDVLETNSDPFMQMKEYRQIDRLGKGGYGEVYRYHNDCLEMDFAVKIYNPVFVSQEEQLEGEKRFFREARIMFTLTNNHIVRLYDAGRIDGKPFIRMELIEGYDLYELHKKEGNLSFLRSALAMTHILNGLQYAHDYGVIHRDLKPSNIIYSVPEKMLKIIDFGVSAFIDTNDHTKLTKTGEHIAGGAFIDPLLQDTPGLKDPRSDIYSVGAIWYFLLCGKPPRGCDMREYLKQANSELQDNEIDIVMKCLSTDIENRYESCTQLLRIIKTKVLK